MARSASKAEKRRALNRVRLPRVRPGRGASAWSNRDRCPEGNRRQGSPARLGPEGAQCDNAADRPQATYPPLDGRRGRHFCIRRLRDVSVVCTASPSRRANPGLIRLSVRRRIYASQQQCCRECTTPERCEYSTCNGHLFGAAYVVGAEMRCRLPADRVLDISTTRVSRPLG